MRQRIGALLSTIVLSIVVAVPALADPAGGNRPIYITLDCAGTNVPVVIQYSATAAQHLVTGTGNFLIKQVTVVNAITGATTVTNSGIDGFDPSLLVTCTYVGPVSGNYFTVVGFFSPRH